jgi:4-hydroxy-3-methylbut-2-en-1-yl diphosphate reductase
VTVGDGPGILVAVSYVDRAHQAVGFGVAVHRDDVESLAAAEREVTDWSRVLRSRRLLIADADPLCWGARRAREMIITDPGAPVYAGGRMADDEHGAAVVRDLAEVRDGGRVSFPAHGTALAIRAEAAARGLRVTDATCPLVDAAHADIHGYADRGDTVVLVGRMSAKRGWMIPSAIAASIMARWAGSGMRCRRAGAAALMAAGSGLLAAVERASGSVLPR